MAALLIKLEQSRVTGEKSQVLLCIYRRTKRIIICERNRVGCLYPFHKKNNNTIILGGFDKTREHGLRICS